MNNSQLINQDSGKVEYYTDPRIIEAAREVMGSIDLDPFSCEFANTNYVKAITYFNKEMDGLTQEWHGKIWMNHPFGRKTNKICIEKLISEYEKGNIKEACCITFAATSEYWFKPLLRYVQCFLSPRTNYYGPDGKLVKGVTKGSVITYLGYNKERFKVVFDEKLGIVK